MNPAVKKIITILNCSEDEAREFCIQTQLELKEMIPSFRKIAKAASSFPGKEMTPSVLAEFIKNQDQEAKSVKKTVAPSRLRRARVKRRRGGGYLGWIEYRVRNFTVDESGALVPKGVLQGLKSHKQKRCFSGQIKPRATEGRGDVFAKLRADFRKNKDIRKRKEAERATLTRKKRTPPITVCPECRCKVRYDRLEKHLRKVHKLVLDKESDKSLAITKSGEVSGKTGGHSKHSRNVAGEQVGQERDDPIYGGKYLGWYRREQGKFGSLPLYEDHDDESGPS
ncbi:MAG: hypothetical protein GTO18_15200 [Anaerolineales bacterium]|nr:hypothetical protein [Anaerolineales bacterium]